MNKNQNKITLGKFSGKKGDTRTADLFLAGECIGSVECFVSDANFATSIRAARYVVDGYGLSLFDGAESDFTVRDYRTAARALSALRAYVKARTLRADLRARHEAASPAVPSAARALDKAVEALASLRARREALDAEIVDAEEAAEALFAAAYKAAHDKAAKAIEASALSGEILTLSNVGPGGFDALVQACTDCAPLDHGWAYWGVSAGRAWRIHTNGSI